MSLCAGLIAVTGSHPRRTVSPIPRLSSQMTHACHRPFWCRQSKISPGAGGG
jgi:hypothetical protein